MWWVLWAKCSGASRYSIPAALRRRRRQRRKRGDDGDGGRDDGDGDGGGEGVGEGRDGLGDLGGGDDGEGDGDGDENEVTVGQVEVGVETDGGAESAELSRRAGPPVQVLCRRDRRVSTGVLLRTHGKAVFRKERHCFRTREPAFPCSPTCSIP